LSVDGKSPMHSSSADYYSKVDIAEAIRVLGCQFLPNNGRSGNYSVRENEALSLIEWFGTPRRMTGQVKISCQGARYSAESWKGEF